MKVTSNTKVKDTIKLLQITDTHLFEAEDGSLLSVCTNESFKAVVEAVTDESFQFDAILATGDISQDHSDASYRRFAEGIKPLKQDCFWLPGNHDYKPSMNSVMPSQQIMQVEHALLGEHWQMVLLDSQVEGVPHGRLSQSQLALLESKLAQYPERHTLVLLHHHPLLVGSAWLDQHTLKDAEQFWQVVERHSNVRAILCGHVHQDMQKVHSGATVIATPSTCVQFKPNSDDFALDSCSPGWRELELHADGSFDTRVKRLEDGLFAPNFDSNGY
ncbi:3',5'-cyclic-AMP phosphodiesterase [Vibrio panuliri]|uniref:3',5'-cyclic adenosine monophosphate phosphodiesterase CpdA n=1 Tax=Vibrio panuliri TaxID=1381081 RepID=A0A1Q9HCH0_9VIBR|nr:3',5'-cyclic-AMP phosphodiesterase [Vibrio panuliri]KAB1455293.1 3',5'-cyclic-AMP phosphodiesterase [Vibrio panuliri]OLQ87086.1 3',5'-cyclic-AMP phosphodiesterase [Vibrio panuliri]OLQ95887.1 3',5'-cyclic-AMP phosphodiesterase [Vibrio panuliri]